MNQDQNVKSMSQGAKGTLDAAKGIASGTKKVARGVRRSAKVVGKVGKLALPIKGILIGILALILLILILVVLTSNAQTRKMSYLSPSGVNNKDIYDKPAYETPEELREALFDKEKVVEDSRLLLLEISQAKQVSKQDTLERALNEYSDIDKSASSANVKYETSNDLEIVGLNDVELSRVSYEKATVNSSITLASVARGEMQNKSSKYSVKDDYSLDFVIYCAEKAEYKLEKDPSKWKEDKSNYHKGVSTYSPASGDIVIFHYLEDEKEVSYIGIVDSFSDGTLTEISGTGESPSRKKWTFSPDGMTAYTNYGVPAEAHFLHLKKEEVSVSEKLSANVLRYADQVKAECNANGIPEYYPYLLAIIQVESGGVAEDVMQSSESLGLAPNTLGRDASIKQGVKAFYNALTSARNKGISDIETVIQSYNYGPGFASYVAENGGKYTFELAESFSLKMAGSDTKIPYSNAISKARGKEYRYGYGNFHYVDMVMQYVDGAINASSVPLTVSKKDYQILAAYSIKLGNGQLVRDEEGNLVTSSKIDVSRNWSLLSLFDGTFGQIDYVKTLRKALENLNKRLGIFDSAKGFYEYSFVLNSDGSPFFYGEREVTEWRWYTDEELAALQKENEPEEPEITDKPETPSPVPVKPGKKPTDPGYIEHAIGSPGNELDEGQNPGVNGEYVTRVETYKYVKPIIKERTMKEVVEELFKLNLDDKYEGSMFDTDGDGYVERSTASATIKEAIYTLAEQTWALLTNDGQDESQGLLTGGLLGCPLNPGTYPITSYFGYRVPPTAGASVNHDAIDVGIPEGTPLVSSEAGVVIAASVDSAGGLFIKIQHDNGYQTWYWHLSSFGVSTGERVARGQQIGLSGNTGISTGPHLHFAVIDPTGTAVDPLPLIGHSPDATHLEVKEVQIGGTGAYSMPLSGRFEFTQDFGKHGDSFHRGLDFACAEGTPVYAVADGKVIMAGFAGDYGWTFPDGTVDTAWGVKIQHADGRVSIYWHLKENGNLVSVGDSVIKGQKIGLSGNTGVSTGPHLHFELMAGQTSIDPKPYLNFTGQEGTMVNL